MLFSGPRGPAYVQVCIGRSGEHDPCARIPNGGRQSAVVGIQPRPTQRTHHRGTVERVLGCRLQCLTSPHPPFSSQFSDRHLQLDGTGRDLPSGRFLTATSAPVSSSEFDKEFRPAAGRPKGHRSDGSGQRLPRPRLRQVFRFLVPVLAGLPTWLPPSTRQHARAASWSCQ